MFSGWRYGHEAPLFFFSEVCGGCVIERTQRKEGTAVSKRQAGRSCKSGRRTQFDGCSEGWFTSDEFSWETQCAHFSASLSPMETGIRNEPFRRTAIALRAGMAESLSLHTSLRPHSATCRNFSRDFALHEERADNLPKSAKICGHNSPATPAQAQFAPVPVSLLVSIMPQLTDNEVAFCLGVRYMDPTATLATVADKAPWGCSAFFYSG